jgi:hypothetical protein
VCEGVKRRFFCLSSGKEAFLPSSTYQRLALLAKMQMYLFVKDVCINEDDYSDNRLIITIKAMGMTAKTDVATWRRIFRPSKLGAILGSMDFRFNSLILLTEP